MSDPERDPDDTTKRRAMPDECDFCGFETKALTEYVNSRTHRDPAMTYESKWKWLCGLCAASPVAGTAHDYGSHRLDGDGTLRAIQHVGNVILKALAEEGGS